MDLHKNLTPEPYSRSNKAKLMQTMGQRILKYSRAIYNSSLSPSSIDLLEKQNLRGGFNYPEKGRSFASAPKKPLIHSGRKFHFKGTQILNLPRLPFGKHSNYEEGEFIQRHFIDTDSDSNAEAIKSFDKLYKKQVKFDRKGKKLKRIRPNYKNNQKDLLVYKSIGGQLCCNKELRVISSYDQQKSQYKGDILLHSFDSIKPVGHKSKKHNPSIEDIMKILNKY